MANREHDELRERSACLANQDPTSKDALNAHMSLLAHDPGNMAAANRLGIALLKLGRREDAEEVFKDALARNPGNEIARKRLDELRRRAAAEAETSGAARGREEWPEWAEQHPDEVHRLFDSGNENWQAFLSVLARIAPSRLTYAQIEERLGWDRGRLRNVIGGTRSADGEATRPYHICSDSYSRSGEWEAWMDVEQAAALQGRLSPSLPPRS